MSSAWEFPQKSSFSRPLGVFIKHHHVCSPFQFLLWLARCQGLRSGGTSTPQWYSESGSLANLYVDDPGTNGWPSRGFSGAWGNLETNDLTCANKSGGRGIVIIDRDGQDRSKYFATNWSLESIRPMASSRVVDSFQGLGFTTTIS